MVAVSLKKKTKKVFKKKNKSDEQTELIIKTRPEWVKTSLANKSTYLKKYNDSIKNNNEFWKKEGKRITWIKPYKKTVSYTHLTLPTICSV